jgi:hypothetical protein
MIIDNSIVDRQGITFLIDGQNQKWLVACKSMLQKNNRDLRQYTNQKHLNLIRVSSRAFAAKFILICNYQRILRRFVLADC